MTAEPLALILAAGAAWGFMRLLHDALIGGLNLSVWVHRKLLERANDR